MSITGSLVCYENNNDVSGIGVGGTGTFGKKNRSLLNTTGGSITSTKQHCASLNSSISNSVITSASGCSGVGVVGGGQLVGVVTSGKHHQHTHTLHQQHQHLHHHHHQNSLQHQNHHNHHVHSTNNSSVGQSMKPNKCRLHLNTLWSIWYGILATLLQGYLIVQGAQRFVGCQLIQWKLTLPTIELDIQIILCGIVLILLPIFLASAIFKVGNLANDGVKLATTAATELSNGRCSATPSDGLNDEPNTNSTLRTLWTHGGPTSAFIHIITALCLLMPRLLLEARMIENGILPKEYIWRTELDFMVTHRDRLVVLSFMTSPYYNSSEAPLLGTTTSHAFNMDNYLTTTVYNSYDDEGMPVTRSTIIGTSPILHEEQPKKQHTFEITHLVERLRPEDFNQFFDTHDNLKEMITSTTAQSTVPTSKATTIGHKKLLTTTSTMMINKVQATRVPSTVTPKIIRNKFITPTTIASTMVTTRLGMTTTTHKIASSTEATIIKKHQQPHEKGKNGRHNGGNNGRGNNNNNNNNNKKHTNKGRERENSKTINKSGHRHREEIDDDDDNDDDDDDDDFDENLELKLDREFDLDKIRGEEISTVFEVSNSNHKPNGQSGKKHGKGKIHDEERRGRTTSTIQTPKEVVRKSLTPSNNPKDSDIHVLKQEKQHEGGLNQTTPAPLNSKIIEIKPTTTKNQSKKIKRFSNDENEEIVNNGVIIEAARLVGAVPIENITTQTVQLTGLSGLLQHLLGTEKPQDPKSKWTTIPPSLEFINLILAILVWSVRYPSVFWSTSKPFAAIFSLQMIANGFDVLLGYAGISVLYKMQICGQALPLQAPTLLLNAIVTISLFLLSAILVFASSLVLYLYGHGRLAARIRDRIVISTKAGDTWAYFAHCASLCFVLALAVVKAPLMHDLSATYRGSLDGAVLAAALGYVIHLFLWIVLWLGLTAKRRWAFKLPPLQLISSSSATQPLLMHTSISRHGRSMSSGGNCAGSGGTGSSNGGSTASAEETIYWPKLTPSSPKLKVTFNEIPSMSSDHDLTEHDGKRCNMMHGLPGVIGETDDGDYATLRGPGGELFHISELGGHCVDLGADDTSEEGKLLACVRDDSVTYASTRDLEPPSTAPTTSTTITTISSTTASTSHSDSFMGSPDQMLSPLAPVTVTVHTNEAHITMSSTPRCLRRGDSGVPNEALTPRSETTSNESSTSPPDRAPSETSSGVHSGEERDDVVIRPRSTAGNLYKPIVKPVQPVIQEEPFGRSTNMKMSSFNNEGKSSATLPLSRGSIEPRQDYPHCSTMPLPIGCHQQYKPQLVYSPNLSKQSLHTTLPNGVRQPIINNHYIRRLPHVKNAESPYGHLGFGSGHHTFSKLLHDCNLPPPIPEDRDSANYSMISEERDIYITTSGN